ncbi:MAG: hypothetical protein OXF88_13905 [Rhodobacteraceae bacterium]|nr:hypothetical protein [Paracoccaceae bacterium]MCY4139745.1 hypothetical protein [Paracoccaceae bacterium]
MENLSSGIRMLGYCDDWHASPGSTIAFKVSCEGVGSYRARIGRVICADLDPLGPGYRVDPVESVRPDPIKGRFQPLYPGSYARIDDPDRLSREQVFTVSALVWPTLPGRRDQTILSHRDDAAAHGWQLGLDADGALELEIGGCGKVSSGVPLLRRRWYLVTAYVDFDAGTAGVGQVALRAIPGVPRVASASMALDGNPAAAADGVPFLIAATSNGATGACRFFDGKIERPTVFGNVLEIDNVDAWFRSVGDSAAPARIRASWDFSRQMTSDRIEDVSGNGIHGRTINLPTRAMTGHNWDSSDLSWKCAPEQYGAIHFHSDDIYDCGWETDFTWNVPHDCRCGFYAAILETDDGDLDYIPFFVRPRAGERTADVAVIVCTATYLAYANTHVKVDMVGSEVMSESVNQISPYELHLHEHRDLGHSTYDHHLDGSGVCYSSSLRPMLTMRPGPYTFNYINDTHLLAWLEHIDQPYDIITDEDIHARGVDAISGYRAIITLSHPEYTSTKMWDAIDGYQQNGGRHLYLGGNGFYWRVGFHDSFPGILECRKCATGVRAWEGEPGEDHLLFTGEPGGLWRTCGRAPQSLVGVGYSSTMFARSTYYRRTAASHDPKFAFIFEGVEPEEVIGNFGRRGGGAAGIEIDRWDPDLGSPPNSVVLASSENVGIDGILSCEEYPIATRGTDGSQHGFVRADMVYFETPAGGAVFSVGSITWITSLSHDGFDNNVARITGNVLRRFLKPHPESE